MTAAFVLTLLSSTVPTTYVWNCLETEEAGPCIQVAGGFPSPYVVNNYALSPGDHADLIGAIFGLDFFVWHGFWANMLAWWITVLAMWAIILRRH